MTTNEKLIELLTSLIRQPIEERVESGHELCYKPHTDAKIIFDWSFVPGLVLSFAFSFMGL